MNYYIEFSNPYSWKNPDHPEIYTEDGWVRLFLDNQTDRGLAHPGPYTTMEDAQHAMLRRAKAMGVAPKNYRIHCGDYDDALTRAKESPGVTSVSGPVQSPTRVLQTTSEERKKYPLASGLLDYFPDALAEVSRVSFLGNEKHSPGQPLHHARSKSTDHADCILRHLAGRGGFDGEIRESAALAWRALALLQEELEKEKGLPLPRGAKP